jgi:hypothetical protein
MNNNENKSQSLQILMHLNKGKELTHYIAENTFGCTRLAARINELRKAGFDIQTRFIKKNGRRYASYWMNSAL